MQRPRAHANRPTSAASTILPVMVALVFFRLTSAFATPEQGAASQPAAAQEGAAKERAPKRPSFDELLDGLSARVTAASDTIVFGKNEGSLFLPSDSVRHTYGRIAGVFGLDLNARLTDALSLRYKHSLLAGLRAIVVVGRLRSFTAKHPEGMDRVLLLGDPTSGMGALAEPECRRIVLALDRAAGLGIPVDWFAISGGAKISMTSGTENLDWTARVLRRIVEFTQTGGTINVVVDGVNVGAQSYWNAEATMLMHTKGTLIMTPRAAMVLTGKRALECSGGVSADDNQGVGGVDRIMGPNGQAQHFARDITEACQILFQHHELTYVAPGERFPRRWATRDPYDRDISASPLMSSGDADGMERVGDIFSAEHNAQRKKAFDIRSVMRAVADQDGQPLPRWSMMHGAEMAVVWDAHLGGVPLCLIGFESRPIQRIGFVPGDGPQAWTGGTLFPLSSKKVARAINAASGNRPVVVLANLSGFDGSPESMRKLQLEYGAEIGRAVVNFQGPIVFCVISRYHGGAYVVFSRALNEGLEAAAVQGSYASVIGGAPATAVVLTAVVKGRVHQDPRVTELQDELARAAPAVKPALRSRLHALLKRVHAEKQQEVTEEFDRIHSVERAQEVGSLDRLIQPSKLRPYLIEAVCRGMERAEGDWRGGVGTSRLPAHRPNTLALVRGSVGREA